MGHRHPDIPEDIDKSRLGGIERTVTEVPIGTVMSRLFYARRKMAALLNDLRKQDS